MVVDLIRERSQAFGDGLDLLGFLLGVTAQAFQFSSETIALARHHDDSGGVAGHAIRRALFCPVIHSGPAVRACDVCSTTPSVSTIGRRPVPDDGGRRAFQSAVSRHAGARERATPPPTRPAGRAPCCAPRATIARRCVWRWRPHRCDSRGFHAPLLGPLSQRPARPSVARRRRYTTVSIGCALPARLRMCVRYSYWLGSVRTRCAARVLMAANAASAYAGSNRSSAGKCAFGR